MHRLLEEAPRIHRKSERNVDGNKEGRLEMNMHFMGGNWLLLCWCTAAPLDAQDERQVTSSCDVLPSSCKQSVYFPTHVARTTARSGDEEHETHASTTLKETGLLLLVRYLVFDYRLLDEVGIAAS